MGEIMLTDISITMKNPRLCITAQDISAILNITPRQASRKLQEVRDAYGKQYHQYLTFAEFAAYTDLPLDELYKRCHP
ncbi:hypothetical protein GCM10011418_41510 [Sphingobacterium alkalisoli]|nr:hypothetical protein GCM10011418_41510 [Sphingobacterium alkalisoli]